MLQQHHAQQEDELSVEKGEKVLVVSQSDDGWWLVRWVGQWEGGEVHTIDTCMLLSPVHFIHAII